MSTGRLWLYFGAFLVLAELLAPGFVIFFFGLPAATVGLLWFVFGEAFDLQVLRKLGGGQPEVALHRGLQCGRDVVRGQRGGGGGDHRDGERQRCENESAHVSKTPW